MAIFMGFFSVSALFWPPGTGAKKGWKMPPWR
jgi:hypothetical protein